MSEQKLNLIQFAARVAAKTCTGATEIVRCEGWHPDLQSRGANHVPDRFFTDPLPQHSSRPADTAEDSSTVDRRRTDPVQQLRVYPVRHRDRANMASFANKVHDGPLILSLLQVFHTQMGGLVAPQTAGQQ